MFSSQDVFPYLAPFSSVVDLSSILAILAVAAFYFFAPALGYRADRRGTLAVSLWTLIASAALSLTNLMLALIRVSETRKGLGATGSDDFLELLLAITFFKGFLFFFGMVFLVVGLLKLERRDEREPRGMQEPRKTEEPLSLGPVQCRKCGQILSLFAERCPNCKEPVVRS